MKYTVEIMETLQQEVEVEADDRNSALAKVRSDYYAEKITFNYPGDCIGSDINIINTSND